MVYQAVLLQWLHGGTSMPDLLPILLMIYYMLFTALEGIQNGAKKLNE